MSAYLASMSANETSLSCSDYFQHPNSIPTIAQDPDIAGAGVVLGYAINALIVVIIIIFFYFTTYDPWEDPFERNDGNGSDPNRDFEPNQMDVAIADLSSRIGRLLRRASTATPQRMISSRLQAAGTKARSILPIPMRFGKWPNSTIVCPCNERSSDPDGHFHPGQLLHTAASEPYFTVQLANCD